MKETRKEKPILVNGAYSAVYKLLNVIFPLISATYVSRILAPEGVGRVAYAQNIVSYFLLFAALGIPYYGTREIARCRENRQEKSRVFSELLSINFFSTAFCVLAYCVFIALVYPANIWFYAVCGLELLFHFLNIDWLYEGEESYVYITVRSLIIKLLSLAALFILVREPQDYIWYALIHCLGISGNYLLNVANAHKKVRLTFRQWNIKRHMKPIMLLMISTILGSLYNKIDITMLGWMSGDEAVGWYTNAHKVIGLVLTLVISVSAVFLPRLSYVYAADRDQYRNYLSLGLKAVLILAVPGCLGVIVVAPNLVSSMFGGAFLPSAATLRILAVFTIVKGVGDLLCYQAIISAGWESKLILSRIVASVANIALNTVLIPRYGHNGAAIASVVSEVIVNGMLLPVSLKIAKPDIQWRFFLSILAGTLLMGAAALTVQHFLGVGAVSLMATVGAGIAAYAVGLLITKNELLTYLKESIRKKN